jgi:hypothetical protein
MRILYDELQMLVNALNDLGVDYAICGGLALAIHGVPRGTVDIDVLVMSEDVEKIVNMAKGLGYEMDAGEMRFSGGDIIIRRVSKLIPEFNTFMPLEMLHVTKRLEPIWKTRESLEWEHGVIKVISRNGLVEMKKISGRAQDMVDIENLEKKDDAS